MRDLCMRSACLGMADVLVVMDVKDLTFTVHDLDEVDGPGAIVLCSLHLDRLKAPRGWALVDSRTGGNLIPLPQRPMTTDEAADEVMRPIADVTPLRPVTAAIHPLESARSARSRSRSTSDAAPSPLETPLLARAFLGVDRHPATLRDQPSAVADPVEEQPWDQDWDQRDPDEALVGHGDEQLVFGGDPGA